MRLEPRLWEDRFGRGDVSEVGGIGAFQYSKLWIDLERENHSESRVAAAEARPGTNRIILRARRRWSDRSIGESILSRSPMSQEINKLIDVYQQALNNADTELIRSVYADDAVFMAECYRSSEGIEDIASFFAEIFDELEFMIEFDIDNIELDHDLGFIQSRSRGKIVSKGDEADRVEDGREIFMIKRYEGQWKIYRYISNSALF